MRLKPSWTLNKEIQFSRAVLADNLRRVRQGLGYSLRDLARLTGLSHSHILKIETGRHDFQVETLGKLAIALGVPCGLLMDSAVTPSSTAFEQAILLEKFFAREEWRKIIPPDWTVRQHRSVLQFASESCVLLAKLLLSTRASIALDRVRLPPVPDLRVAWQELANRIDGVNGQFRWLQVSERASLLNVLRAAPVETLNGQRVFCPRFAIDYVDQIDTRYKLWIVDDAAFQELI